MSALPALSLDDRRASVLALMRERGVESLYVASTGLHMIDVPNPLMHLTGFRSVGPAVVRLDDDGQMSAIVSPAEDGERAGREIGCLLHASDDPMVELSRIVQAGSRPRAIVGFGALPYRIGASMQAALGAGVKVLDEPFYRATAIKTAAELADARRATAIAEQGYVKLKQLARPGLRECDLALALNAFMKEQGADDCFLMLNAAPRADAVMPSSERPLEGGDLILVELSPSVNGQFVQICRTVSLGEPRPETKRGYELLVRAMRAGIQQVKPGRPMGVVCSAIDDLLSEAGFAEFSRPPFIRRRGHGLGAGSTFPGDVAVDNQTILAPGMFFIVHPNQFLPASGYMMCGEPLIVGEDGAVVLSTREARLDVIELAAPSC